MHDLSVDIGQAEVSALEAVSELSVVEAQGVEEGGYYLLRIGWDGWLKGAGRWDGGS